MLNFSAKQNSRPESKTGIDIENPHADDHPNGADGISDESRFDYMNSSLVPPVFAKALRERRKRNPSSRAAVNWYLRRLAKTDVQRRVAHGQTDLEKILRDDAKIGKRATLGSWVPKRTIGAGGFGKVVLWERKSRRGQV